MLWHRKSRGDQAKESYEWAVKKVYTYETISLAMARASYFVGYNVKFHDGLQDLESPAWFHLNGVLNEIGIYERHVPCEVEFVDVTEKDGTIGNCVLTHYDTTSAQKKAGRIEERPMLLKVKIYDPERKYRYIACDVLRDAAISGNRFTHFEIKTDQVDAEEAIRQMRERGYGPNLRIHHLKMFPQILLPNAPVWAWKRDGE